MLDSTNPLASFYQTLNSSIGNGGGKNEDLEQERDAMQRKSFQRSNKVYENNEAKKNAEAVR
ncbi:type III secretion effector protein [Pseudomonas sp. PWP3-1b2]|uniref:type III secretion effector protein n=1 Tax=Pseudomonas sp. PWP3-1b2 TaxID=2804656 RepID=UPI003CE78FDF